MKYILGTFGFVILAVIAIILMATTIGNRNSDRQEGEGVVTLTDRIDDGGTLFFTTEGRIRGEDVYRSIRISVSPTERRIEILKGYDNVVEHEQTLSNTESAYEVFMQALAKQGFSRERETDDKEVKGTCPAGRRFIYQLRDEGRDVFNLWSTSCDSREGTFGGNDSQIQLLFQNQIPNYSQFISGVQL